MPFKRNENESWAKFQEEQFYADREEEDKDATIKVCIFVIVGLLIYLYCVLNPVVK